MERVSVIIPLYNRERFILETLTSVQAQTYPHWEAVVIDDGSTDQSYSVAAELAQQDERIKLSRRDRAPKGAPTCRNIGLSLATGKYVIFLDSDDLMAPHCLAQRVVAIEQQPDLHFAAFNMLLFYQTPGDTDVVWNVDSEESDLVRFLRADGVWSSTGPIYRRQAILEAFGTDEGITFWKEDLPLWQDLELHVRIICRGWQYTKHLGIPDCYNRRHGEASISQQGSGSEAKLRTKLAVYRQAVAHVVQHERLTDEVQAAIVAFLFNQARQLVADHRHLPLALDTWAYASQWGNLSARHARTGERYFRYLHRHQLSGRRLSIYLFLAKFTAGLLPRQYQHTRSTLCQVTR